jgi:hypothetical protein
MTGAMNRVPLTSILLFTNLAINAGFFYPSSQKTTSLPVVECVIDRLLRRDVAHNLGG